MSNFSNFHLFVPLLTSELLHATLGPLADQLRREGHAWAPMLHRALTEYTSERNNFLVDTHGPGVVSEISHTTYQAAEKLCALTEDAVAEELDFIAWQEEVVDADGDFV